MSPAVPAPERLARWADLAVAKAPGKHAATARGWLAQPSDNAELQAHADALLAALDRAQRCRVCGRPLEVESSQLAGIGPDCAEKRAAEAALVARAVA